MINFKKITISNFMSFGKKSTEVLLDTNLSTLIIGKNEDNGSNGYSKNGVGKSTLFQAICYVLFGDSFSNIKQDDFINVKNKKKMFVKLEFDIDNDSYSITRGRKPLVLEVLKNGNPFTLHSARNEDEAIQELLGMDLNMFLNTVMLTNNVSSFMFLKPTAQKQFFEQLIKIDLLTNRSSLLKTFQKDTSVDIKLEEQKKIDIENNNKTTQNTIDQLKEKSSNWEQERLTGIIEYEAELDSLNTVNIEDEVLKIQELESIEEEFNTISKTIDTLSSKLKNDANSLENYEHELHTLMSGTCPYCNQGFVSDEKISEVNTKMRKLNDNIESLTNDLEPMLEQEEHVKTRLDMFLSKNPDLLTIDQCQSILHRIDKINDKINSLKEESINPYNEQIELLTENLKEVDYTTYKNLVKLDNHYKILLKLLTDNKSFIRKNIIEQYVPFFNTKINEYLEKLESPNRVIINNDLSVDIAYMHTTLSFGNLSTGEKIRVSFALSLAFNDFNSMLGSKFNVLFIDEILDSGLDSSGFYNILKVLKSRNESLFIISHRDELIPEVDTVMTVVKKGGFTNIQ